MVTSSLCFSDVWVIFNSVHGKNKKILKNEAKTTKTVHSTSIQTHYSFTLKFVLLPSLKVYRHSNFIREPRFVTTVRRCSQLSFNSRTKSRSPLFRMPLWSHKLPNIKISWLSVAAHVSSFC